MLLTASITQPIIDWAVGVVGDLGLWGIFLLMAPESAGIPIPSEATMLFAGFNVERGEYTLLAATLVATFANLMGSWVAYYVGAKGRIELLEKHGKVLHLKPSHLQWADRWFERYGSAAVFFSRMLPIIRTFISLPAGVARMPFVRFSVLTFLGALPWNLLLTFVGMQAAGKWEDWQAKLHYLDLAVVLLVLAGLAFLAVRWFRGRGDGGTPAVDAL